MKKRPTLAVSIATSLQAGAENRGLRAYIPFWMVASAVAGYAVAFYLPAEFWSDDKWDVSTAVFAGFLAFNGLLLALGWFAFAKIYETLTGTELGAMLTRHGMLGVHLAFIDVSHFVLVFSSIASVLCLVTVLLPVPLWADRIAIGTSISLTVYGLCRAISATRMMNDLVWEQAHLAPQLGPRLAAVENAKRD